MGSLPAEAAILSSTGQLNEKKRDKTAVPWPRTPVSRGQGTAIGLDGAAETDRQGSLRRVNARSGSAMV